MIDVIMVNLSEDHIARGLRGDPCECPIAIALRAMGYEVPSVWRGVVRIGPPAARVTYTLGADGVAFVHEFDDPGRWRQGVLLRPPKPCPITLYQGIGVLR